MAEDREQLVLSISADVTQLQRALKRLAGDTKAAGDQIAQGLSATGPAANKAANDIAKVDAAILKSGRGARAASVNLTAQLNDIALGLASGTSPFTIMVQQGSQVTQALNAAKLSGASLASTLIGGFGSMINPMSLATLAVIGLGGALIQYLFSASEKIPTLDEALKKHGEFISRLKDNFGDAITGLEKYAKESQAVFAALGAAQAAKDLATLTTEAEKLKDAFSGVDVEPFGGARAFRATEAFKLLRDEVEKLSTSTDPARIAAFRQKLAELAATEPENAALQALVAQFLLLSEEALKAEVALKQTTAAMDLIGSSAALQAEQVEKMAKAIAILAATGVPALSDMEQALKAYNDALANSVTEADVTRATDAFRAAQERIATAQIPIPQFRGVDDVPTIVKTPKAPRTPDSIFAQDLLKTEQNIKLKQAEYDALVRLGPAIEDYGFAVREASEKQRLLNEAEQAGVTVTPELEAKIDSLAKGYARASASVDKLKEAQAEAQRVAEEFASVAKDFLSGFIDDLRAGKTATEALGNALSKLADKLLNSALDDLFGALTGKSTGSGSGILAGLASLLGGSKSGAAAGVIGSAVGASAIGGGTITASMAAYRGAIAAIESGSVKGNYSALGVLTDSGDRALGKYQVMGANVSSWTKEALGSSLTKSQFLASPSAQDAVFDQQFGKSISKFGNPQDAASVWFTGRPQSGGGSSKDILGTSGNVYVEKFNAQLEKLGGTTGKATAGLDKVGSASGTAASGLSDAGKGLSGFGANLQTFMASAQGGGSSWFQNLAGMFGGASGALGFMNSISPLATGAILSGSWGLYHEGGTAGHARRKRHGVDPRAFIGAPRYHQGSGGAGRMLGLKPGDVPSILQEGEIVLPRGTRAKGSGAGMKVNIYNNGAAVRTEESRDKDGNVALDVIVDRVVASKLSSRGTASNSALRKNFGAQQILTRR